MLITDQVATAPCTDPIQVRLLLLRQRRFDILCPRVVASSNCTSTQLLMLHREALTSLHVSR